MKENLALKKINKTDNLPARLIKIKKRERRRYSSTSNEIKSITTDSAATKR